MDKTTAYHEWLAIPPNRQPPNYYVLLNIPEFETSQSVIENGAHRNVSFLQKFFSGPDAELAQQIQKEVMNARKVLRSLDSKAAYDEELAEKISQAESAGSIESSIFRIKEDDVIGGSTIRSVRDIINDGIRASMILSERKNWLIGWDPERCDIIVDNDFVSSKHCILFLEDEEFEIEDLGSTNGTWVNGKKLESHKRYPVKQRDDVTLGIKTIMPWPPIDFEARNTG